MPIVTIVVSIDTAAIVTVVRTATVVRRRTASITGATAGNQGGKNAPQQK